MSRFGGPFLPVSFFLIVALSCMQSTGASKICQEKVADVVFLLDSSYSIWTHQFRTQLDFLSDLVSGFTVGPNNMRVGVVTFSTKVRLDVALDQYMDQPKELLQKAIGGIRYMQGGTRTGDAIRFAHSKMFTKEHGSRPWAAHILILITDGYSYNSTQTSLEASVARSKGIQLFAIGVGSGVDERELRAIASDPDDSHVFHVESYDALKKIEKSLTRKTCHKTNTSKPVNPPEEQEDDPKDTVTKRCGGKPADIYFLLDSSSSIWSVHFGEELRFVSQLLQLFDVGEGGRRTRVGVAVYSDHVHNVVSLSDPQTPSNVQQALAKAPYLTGGTNTGKALHYVRTQGFAQARQEVAHVIIVLTDGQSANTKHTLKEAHAAHEQGIYVFSVGIGSSTDIEELMEIASDPDENFMFHVDNFQGLQNIRELLAIKTCDVQTPDYQGDQASSECHIASPTDIVFVYDAASVSRAENDVISEVIRNVVQKMDPDPLLVRFGLVRENCFKGDNLDLRTGGGVNDLQAVLKKSIHRGLHSLLKRIRLYDYLTPARSNNNNNNDDDLHLHRSARSRSRKVVVLFAGNKMADDSAAVERELSRLKFQGVGVLVVTTTAGPAGKEHHLDMLGRVSSVAPVELDSPSSSSGEDSNEAAGQRVFEAFCEVNKMKLPAI